MAVCIVLCVHTVSLPSAAIKVMHSCPATEHGGPRILQNL